MMPEHAPARPPEEAQVLREFLESRPPTTAVTVTASFQYIVDGPPEGAEARALSAYFAGVEPFAQLDVQADCGSKL